MKRRVCVLGLCVVLARAAVAGEPPQKPESGSPSTTSAAQSSVASGRKQLEALLATPAKLDFGGRKLVTVREVLDRLHEQHHLSLRFDTPTLASLLGTPSGASGRYPAMLQTASLFGPATAFTGISCSPGYCSAPFEGPIINVAGQGGSPARTAPPPVAAAAPANVAPATAAPASNGPAVLAAPLAPQSVDNGNEAVPPAALPSPSDSEKAGPADGPKPILPAESSPPATPDAQRGIQEILGELLKIEVDVQNLDLSQVSIATVLRHALDAAPTNPLEDYGGMPILYTNAMLLDYLVEEDGLLITTRVKALTTKETRVYSVKHLHDLPTEQLAKTIRQSIRPWSWRSQINDLGDQLKGAPLPGETLASIVKAGAQLAGSEIGFSVTPVSTEETSPEAKKSSSADEARQMEMVGNAVVNGLVTLAQATISALEMMHYAEPPTGTIQTLGSKLVITQSQSAHREIAELLKQLAEE